jgi:hypothetical protein
VERERANELSRLTADAIARCERALAESRALAAQNHALRLAVQDTLGSVRRRRAVGRAAAAPPRRPPGRPRGGA